MAEGGGLLNRYTIKSRIGGSNPPLSASLISIYPLRFQTQQHEGFEPCASMASTKISANPKISAIAEI